MVLLIKSGDCKMELKTAEDVYKFIDENIEYGWIDCLGNKRIMEHPNFERKGIFQMKHKKQIKQMKQFRKKIQVLNMN